MHQAHAVALDVKAAARLQGPRYSGAEKGGVNALRLVKTPNTCANLGAGAKSRPAQKLALVAFYPHRLATVAAPALDGRFKDPGMAALQGALFAGAKAYGFHAGYCRCAGLAGFGGFGWFFIPPYPPGPLSTPAGWKGGAKSTFDFVASASLLLTWRHVAFVCVVGAAPSPRRLSDSDLAERRRFAARGRSNENGRCPVVPWPKRKSKMWTSLPLSAPVGAERGPGG